jgi:hypothetical protein
VVLFVASGAPLSWITHTFPEVFRPIGSFVLGAVLAGAVLLPFRGLKWYWAVLLGPLVSATLLVGINLGVDFISSHVAHPEV